uniref:Uncharacterized protein n=1 Tax=Hordeum vulgare subsp. vulgare TaxID=112509 RepID=A0A8I6Y3B1_HORVV
MGHVNLVTSVDTAEEEKKPYSLRHSRASSCCLPDSRTGVFFVLNGRNIFSIIVGKEVGSIGRPQLTFQAPPPRPAGQRQRKKMRLPEVQQLVRSLAVENESLHEEMRALQRACSALSKENDKLETRIEQSNSRNEATLKEHKGKQQLDQQQQQSPHDSFALPDLNLPAQDGADGSVHC